VQTSSVTNAAPPAANPTRRDLQQTFRLLLATVWLMDAALQVQPFMFTGGDNGFSGMLRGTAGGNPTWIAHTITWNASVVQHQPILINALFAGIQFLIAFGIAWRRTVKPALVLSVAWSIAVWWFGEGLGGLFNGAATPLGGGPGSVLYYALLALLLWPTEGPNEPFVASRTVGVATAKAIWAATWAVLAILSVVGSGRSPEALHDLVADLSGGQPAWLLRIDHWVEAVLLHDGTSVAVLFALFCLVVAVSVYAHPKITQVVLAAALVTVACIWVAVQDVGGIFLGGATDPNSGPLLILLIFLYWPLTVGLGRRSGPASMDAAPATPSREH
jgi:hypothetical protein